MTDHRRGLLAGASAYCLWGLFPLYFRQLRDVNPAEVVCIRIAATLAAAVVALLALRRVDAVAAVVRTPRRLLRVALAGSMVTANWAIYVWAVAHDHVVDGAIGYFVNPLISVALGVLLLKERLRPLQLFALLLGGVSVAILTIDQGRVPWIALSLALSFALYGYLKKTASVEALASLGIETAAMLPFAVAGIIYLAADRGLDAPRAAGHTQVLLITVGVVTALPLLLFGIAARHLPLSTVGLLQYVTPVLQLLCGVIAFGESVSAARWLGVGVVSFALIALGADSLSAGARSGT